MHRGVTQLLFTYLPGRMVDWEDGLAIVELTHVRLGGQWCDDKARAVLREVAAYLEAWKQGGGTVHPLFPDPTLGRRLVVGEPTSILARPLQGALICRQCSRLEFKRRPGKSGMDLACAGCGSGRLRQFGQVFVHGCGEYVPLRPFLPWLKTENGEYKVSAIPLKCSQCGTTSELAIPSHSERVRDMSVVCLKCKVVVLPRLKARCPECSKQLQRTPAAPSDPDGDPTGDSARATAVARVVMRLANSRANDAFYPHTLSILRLDKPSNVSAEDPRVVELTALLPESLRPAVSGDGTTSSLEVLMRRLSGALKRGDVLEARKVQGAIAGMNIPDPHPTKSLAPPQTLQADVLKSVEESLAFVTSIHTEDALDVVRSRGSAAKLLLNEIDRDSKLLGLEEVLLVHDLPVIAVALGYTRRSDRATYDEESLGATGLPTQLRPFPSLDHRAALRLGRLDFEGQVPILAREGEHEGLFLSLDQGRVLEWLSRNGVPVPAAGERRLSWLLSQLEPVNRYSDDIWEKPVRRLVFGLLHSFSHLLMRVLSPLAGLERTSVAEYILLPLLGTIVYANGSSMKLGSMETVVRDHMHTLLNEMVEGTECLYDPDCIDTRGACHGCLHAPEIACRSFNHGLSRAFLRGGHCPWVDPAIPQEVAGYWR